VYLPNASVEALKMTCAPCETLTSALGSGWPLALSVTVPEMSELVGAEPECARAAADGMSDAMTTALIVRNNL
jgi:hypothetical protein